MESLSGKTLHEAFALRVHFYIERDLYPILTSPTSISSQIPPFLPEEPLPSAIAAWAKCKPFPVSDPPPFDPFFLLLSPALAVSCIPTPQMVFKESGKQLCAFMHEIDVSEGASMGFEIVATNRALKSRRRYYCLEGNCVYNLNPVSIDLEGFSNHLEDYHGVKRYQCSNCGEEFGKRLVKQMHEFSCGIDLGNVLYM
ncbi:hypothetical protein ABW20_dc0105810 [Dactylellina cionopaga]|nr:hypothetical protein ABW20_dc0105810 [Dactylellina cionopaga]